MQVVNTRMQYNNKDVTKFVLKKLTILSDFADTQYYRNMETAMRRTHRGEQMVNGQSEF